MISQFALRLLVGVSLTWLLMPRRDVTAGFFRIQMLVALGLTVVSGLAYRRLSELAPASRLLTPSAGLGVVITIGVLAYLGSIFWTLNRRRAGDGIVVVIAGLSSLALFGTLVPLEIADPLRDALRGLGELATALALGGVLTSMLLGHWYLTAPTMSIDPLRAVTRLYGIAVVGRLLISTAALATGWKLIPGTTEWVWLVLRWLAGIAGPLLVVALVFGTLKYRNTQSATGILFVGVILSFIGELMGTLLLWELGHPF